MPSHYFALEMDLNWICVLIQPCRARAATLERELKRVAEERTLLQHRLEQLEKEAAAAAAAAAAATAAASPASKQSSPVKQRGGSVAQKGGAQGSAAQEVEEAAGDFTEDTASHQQVCVCVCVCGLLEHRKESALHLKISPVPAWCIASCKRLTLTQPHSRTNTHSHTDTHTTPHPAHTTA